MRYFLLFFLCLFLNFASYATEGGEKKLIPFLMKTQETADSFQKALTESMKVEKGLFTGEKGLTPFFETEFAFFRLMSCEGGIPNSNRLFLMIESKLKEGWRLKKPLIPQMENKPAFVLSEQIAYPLNLKTPQKTSFYEEKAYFPLLYELSKEAQIFELKKEIPFTACKENICKTALVPFEMTLDRTNTYQTDVCALMMHEFQTIPTLPRGDELEASLHKMDENYLLLKLAFKRDVSYLDLQIEDDFDWQIFKIEYKKNLGQILLYTPQKFNEKEVSIKLISSLGAFDLKLPVSTGGYTPFKPQMSYISLFIGGVGLLFFSPLLLVFLMLKDTKKALKHQVKVIKYTLFMGAFLLALCVYFFDGFKMFFEVPKTLWLIPFALLVYLFIKPKITMKEALFFVLVWPKPYLLDVLYSVESHSYLIFVVFGVWAFICYLPFKMCQNIPQFFKEIKKVKQYPYLIRIPQAVMLVWLIVVGAGHFFFESKKIQDFDNLIAQNKTVFISVENGYCLSCLFNKIKLAYIQKTTDLILNNNLEIITLDTKSQEGHTFLMKNHLDSFSYGLLYGQKVPYPVLIWGSVALEEWQKYLDEVTDISNMNKHFVSGKDGEH